MSVENQNIDLDKAEKYNLLLHVLEKNKKSIFSLVYHEMSKAVKQEDVLYYKLLLPVSNVQLYTSDYNFMDKYKKHFVDNQKYIVYRAKLEKQMISIEKEKKEKKELELQKDHEAIKSFKIDEDIIIKIEEEEKEKSKKYARELLAVKKAKVEREKFNESIGIKEILLELKQDEKKEREGKNRKASTPDACLGYLEASNKILREDNERYKPTNYNSIESLKSVRQSLIASKKANIYINKYSKYNCKRHIDNASQVNINVPQKKYSSIIMSACRKKWNTNYNMVKYCVDNQTESKRSLGL